MTSRRKLFCQVLILTVILFSAHATAFAGDDFGMIVKNIESRYNAKRKKIPFLGVAGFLVKIVRPAGVKGFKFAIFEDQDFRPGPRDTEFEKAVRKSLSRKWKPMLKARSRLEGNRSYVYSQPAGKDIKLLSVTFTRQQAIVVEAKVNPDSLMKFMEKPEIMGFSLAGVMGNGPSLASIGNNPVFNGGGNNSTYNDNRDNRNRDRGENSLESLRAKDYDQPDEREAKTPPALKRSKEDAVRNSNSDPAQPETSGLSSTAPPEEGVVKLEARLVNLNVRAIDRSGISLSDLKKEDFTIYEDDARQDIFSFEPVNAPINLVLLLDLSGSTKDKRIAMAEAVKKFIDSLGGSDRIAIAAFTRDFVVVSDFTTDRRALKDRIDNIDKIQGGTAFYDAMWKTLNMLARVEDGRKAIVVLTDGVDNSLSGSGRLSAEHSFDELLSRIEEEDATIYPIHFSDVERAARTANTVVKVREDNKKAADINRQVRAAIRESMVRPHEIARQQLDELAEMTAGKVFEATSEEDLDGVYEQVAAELRLLYSLSYMPRNADKDGRFRKIRVEINREGAIVKSKPGYYAK